MQIGTWRHYRSIFHYEKVGNAYCYVYETFAALLTIALADLPGRKLLRDTLHSYVDKLMKLWGYAESTRIPLKENKDVDDPGAVGWCSGHRLHHTDPESWATASVLSFAQALRRLLGVWTREAARKQLNLVKPTFDEEPEKILKGRGDTWTEAGKPTVTQQLYTMFVNPALKYGDGDGFEPDTEPIQKEQARSAILFGPPGTSKTTLCRAVAKAIDWDYIELHASHFVSDGLQNVQKKADEIFRQLMELDRAVVLFDEIDELVREREKEHDAFGRFLTTSMLPKLAELWSQRKIIYFVATNHIDYFDAAITRSRRFDALILVAPPSYESKMRRLEKLLGGFSFDPLKDVVWAAVKKAGAVAGRTSPEKQRKAELKDSLAKFALLRFDQLDELGARLKSVCGSATHVDGTILREALRLVTDHRLQERAPYIDFVRDLGQGHRDFGLELVWRAEGLEQEYPPEVVKLNGKYWLTILGSNSPLAEVGGLRLDEHATDDTAYYRKAT